LKSINFKISSFSVILVFVCLTIIGIIFIPKLTVKVAPSQMLPSITVRFSMSGSAPIVVEREATSKLEAMFSRMRGLRKITSVSGNGNGRITLQFDKHANIDISRFEVSTIIRQAWPLLPDNVSYPSISVSRSDNNSNKPFLNYSIISPASPKIIQDYVEHNIKNKLARTEGISQINVSGAKQMVWELEYDYKKLENIGIEVKDIQAAISLAQEKEFLGIALISDKNNNDEWIRIALAPDIQNECKEQLENIEIKGNNGNFILLKDIVTIKHIEAKASYYYRINGKNIINMSITPEEDANQLKLAKTIKNKLEEIKKTLPANYDIQLNYDATEYIKSELEKVYFRTGLTILILLLFVFLVYRNLKYGLLIVISAIANISIAFIFYYFLKLEIQLYSIAAIAISLTLIMDNTIIMSDQIIKKGNKKAILAILATTITTIGALCVVFFLEEKIRLNLIDFSLVIIINLVISLFTALFLVPALIEKLNIGNKKKSFAGRRRLMQSIKKKIRAQRLPVYFYRFYRKFCLFCWKKRVIVITMLVLLFGLPVFLLPDKLDGHGWFDNLYNETIGSSKYKESVKPHVETILGGTWRLFVQKVYEGSYFIDKGEETSLNVTASLPNGATVEQMNNLVQQMEKYISQFDEIKQFETNISSAYRANISITFKKEYQNTGFPHILKSDIISKALELGGGSWNVVGLGDGFSNDVRENAGSYKAEMLGYNYDELESWANKFKNNLLQYKRIKDVTIDSEFSWYKGDYQEFYFTLNKERLIQEEIQANKLFSAIKPFFEKQIPSGRIITQDGTETIIITSKQSSVYNVWDMNNIPIKIGDRELKLSELVSIEKYQSPKNIAKIDQQYKLCIQYDYIGSYQQGQNVLEQEVDKMQKELPVGYTIKEENSGRKWKKENSAQYWLLGLIVLIIFFCSGILFNSLRQPFCIIFIIPISFIGIFLTFYWFKLNFDQGGFASFILLSGLTVNANIYILNEYNNIRVMHQNISPLRAYLKAWNSKIGPIFLTVLSTILGFIPFIIGYREGFWFPLAAGTIGGLLVSLIATFCFLPLFMGVAKSELKNKK